MTTKVLLIGAGNIGEAIAFMLAGSGDYTVTVTDLTDDNLKALPDGVEGKVLDVTDKEALDTAMAEPDMVVSACPYFVNEAIARSARQHDVHYLDLTEDVRSTRAIREIAADADTAFIPQCGLAPGFISIAAFNLAQRFDTLRRVRMRVGALPLFPSNALNYNLTWSTVGLINEYCNPCEVIYDGEPREVLPLEGYEQFSLDGVTYEAFNTSGGLGTLCETLAGKVDNLNYKTIRYPGHCELIRFLCNDLRLSKRRELFKDVLEAAVPVTTQDVVLIFVTVSGTREDKLTQETYTHKVYHGEVGGKHMAAIQITTAAALCAMVDMLREGTIPQKGFLKQEDVSFDDFLANRFGRHYESD